MLESIKLVESKVYRNYLILIEKKVGLKILDKYRDNTAKRDADKMSKAEVNAIALKSILENDKSIFTEFVFSKIRKFDKLELKEDYPLQSLEQEDNNEQILGYAKGFVLQYLIEYHLLKYNSEKLELYNLSCRIPQAKKYAKQLIEIYNEVSKD